VPRIATRRLGWKVYFGFIMALLGAVIWSDFVHGKPLGVVDVIDYLAASFSLVALYGFAFSKAILQKHVWRLVLPAVICWDLYLIGKDYIQNDGSLDVWFSALLTGVMLLLLAPLYVAIYLYGYRSEALWKESH
jgi:hypothetical protein